MNLSSSSPTIPVSDSDCHLVVLSPRSLMAEGICMGLQHQTSLKLQARFEDTAAFLQQPVPCDLILINADLIQYPLTDFFAALNRPLPLARLLVFSAETGTPFLKSLLRAGVYGHVPLTASREDLHEAIASVRAGHLYYSREVMDEMIFDAIAFETLIEKSIKDRLHVLREQLTPREQDIFCLLLEGLSTREIALQIHMSEPTVKQHLTSLFKKFDVNNRSQLILSIFEKVCPVTNMMKLFRHVLGRRRHEKPQPA